MGTRLEVLEEQLYLLLHDARFRDRAREGRVELAAELREVDGAAIDALGASLAEAVSTRSHAGTGSLRERYAQTLASGGGGTSSLFSDFLASPELREHGELPDGAGRACVEEAFFRFCVRTGVGDPVVREREYLEAVLRALAVSPRPSFSIPREVKKAPAGWFALTSSSPPWLFAALGDRFVRGEVTVFLADLLTSPESAVHVGTQHGVPAAVRDEAVRHLSALGLLSEP